MNTVDNTSDWYISEFITVLNQVSKIISFESIALIFIIVAIYQYIRDREAQHKTHIAIEHKKRFEQVFVNLPSNIYESSFEIETLDIAEKEAILRYMRTFFDLNYEASMLYKKKQIEKKEWSEIKTELEYALTKPAFQDAWFKLNQTRGYQNKFANLIRKIIDKSNKKQKVDPVQATPMLNIEHNDNKY